MPMIKPFCSRVHVSNTKGVMVDENVSGTLRIIYIYTQDHRSKDQCNNGEIKAWKDERYKANDTKVERKVQRPTVQRSYMTRSNYCA